MPDVRPFNLDWMRGAIRHIERNVEPDAFWSATPYEREVANLPTYLHGNDCHLLAAAPVMKEALQAVLGGDPDALTKVVRALNLSEGKT